MVLNVELLTIGYGGKKPSKFFDEIKNLDPEKLVDIRKNPFKAYLGCYTKQYIEKKFKNEYIWIKELGNETRSLPPKLVNEEIGFRKLENVCRDCSRIVLLCAEKDESRCHRKYVKEKMEKIIRLK